MTGRQSYSVMLAVRLVRSGELEKVAAIVYGVDVSSIRRALRAEGDRPLKRGRRAKSGAS